MVARGVQGEGEVQGAQEGQVIVEGVVVVPGEAGAVDEDGALRGDGGVVVDEEGEVGDSLVGAVGGDAEGGLLLLRGGRGVDVIYAHMILARQLLRPPRVSVAVDVRDHQRRPRVAEPRADAVRRREGLCARAVADAVPGEEPVW